MIPVLGKLKLFLTDKELIIPQGSLYIINSQEIHGMHHTEDTDIYKGYALQINYDFIKKYYFTSSAIRSQTSIQMIFTRQNFTGISRIGLGI